MVHRSELENLTKDQLMALAQKYKIYLTKSTTKYGMINELQHWLPSNAVVSSTKRRRSSTKRRSSGRRPRFSSGRRYSGIPRRCTRQYTKKYTTRPSPSYPANACKGRYMTGNDGHRYKSVVNSRGIGQWRKV